MTQPAAIREEFVEVGRFTGAAGGRIKVTAELFRWIYDRQFVVERRLAQIWRQQREDRPKIEQAQIIAEIQRELLQGGYNDEQIDLSPWTIKYIINGRYRDRLAQGRPAPEWQLQKEQKYRDEYNLLKSAEEQAGREQHNRWFQIWATVRNNPDLLVDIGNARTFDQIATIFPLTQWPTGWTVDRIKADIKFAVSLKPRALAGRRPRRGTTQYREIRPDADSAEASTRRRGAPHEFGEI